MVTKSDEDNWRVCDDCGHAGHETIFDGAGGTICPECGGDAFHEAGYVCEECGIEHHHIEDAEDHEYGCNTNECKR